MPRPGSPHPGVLRMSMDATTNASVVHAARTDGAHAAPGAHARDPNNAFFVALPQLIKATSSTKAVNYTQLATDLHKLRGSPQAEPLVTALGLALTQIGRAANGYNEVKELVAQAEQRAAAAERRAAAAEQHLQEARQVVAAMQAAMPGGAPAADAAMQAQLQALSAEVKSQQERAAAAEQRAAAAQLQAKEAMQAVAAMQAEPPAGQPALATAMQAQVQALSAQVEAHKESLAKVEQSWSMVVRHNGKLRHVPAAPATSQAVTQVRLVFRQPPHDLGEQQRSQADAVRVARRVLGALHVHEAAVLGAHAERPTKAAPTRVTLVVNITPAAYSDIMG